MVKIAIIFYVKRRSKWHYVTTVKRFRKTLWNVYRYWCCNI